MTFALIDRLEGSEWLLALDFVHVRDDNSVDGVSKPQKIEALKGYFKDYAPVIQKALSFAKEAHIWRMVETMPQSWVSKSGKVVLIGDSAHAVLPYVGQVFSRSHYKLPIKCSRE